MRRIAVPFAALFLVLTLSGGALAVKPDEMLDDPVLEARARALSKGIRCLVCQNQSIDDSDADLARDLRILVRQRLLAGDTDEQVLDYLVKRYGEFVLLRPRLRGATYLLWYGPAILLLFGAIAAFVYLRRRARSNVNSAPLSEEERRRLADLLEEKGGRS